jgi:hypothetical protein
MFQGKISPIKEIPINYNLNIQSMIPESTLLLIPGNLLVMQILGSIPYVLQQKLWSWDSIICLLASFPGDSKAC